MLEFTDDGETYAKYRANTLPHMVSDEIWEDLYLVRYPKLESLLEMVGTETWARANEDRERGLDLTWAFPTRP